MDEGVTLKEEEVSVDSTNKAEENDESSQHVVKVNKSFQILIILSFIPNSYFLWLLFLTLKLQQPHIWDELLQ